MASTPCPITFTIPIAAPPSKNIANEKVNSKIRIGYEDINPSKTTQNYNT